MINTGHSKEQSINESDKYTVVEVKSFGENGTGKRYIVENFGSISVLPENTRVLVVDSVNNDQSFVVGVLNKLRIDGLAKGEQAIYSTDDKGEQIKTSIVLRNSGDVEIESEGNVNITATKFNVNNGNLTVD